MDVLERLDAVEQIRSAVHRYCRGVDRLDVELMRSAYLPGAVDDHGTRVGDAADLCAHVVASHARYDTTLHSVLQHAVEVDGPDTARGEAYVVTHLVRTDGTGRRWHDTWYGRYADRYGRADGRWGIAHRVCVHELTESAPLGPSMPVRSDLFAQGSADPGHRRRPRAGRLPGAAGMSRPVAVVTGAGQGIGRAVAGRLAADGHEVVCVDRDAAAARRAAQELGGRPMAADVRDEAAAAALADELDRCDVLVNNAAVWRFTPLLETPVDQALEVLHVNVVGTLVWMKALVPLMGRGGGGSVVNLSSVTALSTATRVGLYPASKAAVITLSKQAALEFAPLGVRVNVVGPGMIVTEGTEAAYGTTPEQHAERGRLLPLGRLGAADDIAGTVAFLSSPDASYVTGQVLWVDGGFGDAGNEFYRAARGATRADMHS